MMWNLSLKLENEVLTNLPTWLLRWIIFYPWISFPVIVWGTLALCIFVAHSQNEYPFMTHHLFWDEPIWCESIMYDSLGRMCTHLLHMQYIVCTTEYLDLKGCTHSWSEKYCAHLAPKIILLFRIFEPTKKWYTYNL